MFYLDKTIQYEYNEIGNIESVTSGFTVGIPSPLKLGIAEKYYYDAPWESEADKLGGVIRTSDNTPWPKEECDSYWDIFKLFFK